MKPKTWDEEVLEATKEVAGIVAVPLVAAGVLVAATGWAWYQWAKSLLSRTWIGYR
jgi:hypothetical protein